MRSSEADIDVRVTSIAGNRTLRRGRLRGGNEGVPEGTYEAYKAKSEKEKGWERSIGEKKSEKKGKKALTELGHGNKMELIEKRSKLRYLSKRNETQNLGR